MSIFKNLEKVHAAVVVNNVKGKGQLGAQIGALAVKAIMGGIKSPDWNAYMSLFADNADQLKLLTVETVGEEDWLAQQRAYIVSNAVCAGETGTFTSSRVRTDFGAALSETLDAATIKLRPIVIPEV
jgi:hypothetical protein